MKANSPNPLQTLHPNGRDTGLKRYSSLDKDFNKKLIAESVAELLNFCADDTCRDKLMSKVTWKNEFSSFINNISREIREEQFDPVERGCHSNYNWFTSNIQEGYLSYEPDQCTLVGSVSSLAKLDMCFDMAGFEVPTLYYCRSYPLTVTDQQMMTFTKNGAIMTPGPRCFDTENLDYEGSPIKGNLCHAPHPVEGEPGESQKFVFIKEHQWVQNPPSGKCVTMTVLPENGSFEIIMMKCDVNNEKQKWTVNLTRWFFK